MYVTIDPPRFFRWHCAIIAGLLVVHLGFGLLDVLGGHDRVFGLARVFDVRREGNVPTLLSVLALLGAALVGASIAATYRRLAGRYTPTWGWITAALLFAAIDEGVQLHELLSPPLRAALGTTGPLYFTWIVPYSGATVLGTLVAFPALRALGREPTRWVLGGVALMFAGAVGVEMLQGDLWSREGAASSETLLNFALATLEESLELVGEAFLLRGLLTGLSARLAGRPLGLGIT